MPDTSPTQSRCPPAKTKTATTKHISLAPAAAAGSKIQTPRKSPAQKSAWPENGSAAFPKRPSRLVSSRGFKRMQRRQQIQDSRRRQKSRPVVSVGVRNVRAVGFECPRRKIKAPAAKIRGIPQGVESVITRGRKDITPHARAKKYQQRHGKKTRRRTPPHFQERVSQSRHQPSRHGNRQRHPLPLPGSPSAA